MFQVKKEGTKQNILLVSDFGKCLQYQKYNFIDEDCKAKYAIT